jgi:ferredoxin
MAVEDAFELLVEVLHGQRAQLEELCNGCGVYVSPCAEGAIQIVNDKARVLHEELCDGAGFCLGVCPTGALSIEVREAVAFDEHAAEIEMEKRGKTYIEQTCYVCGQGKDSQILLPCRKLAPACGSAPIACRC